MSPDIKRSNFLAILPDQSNHPFFEESQHGSIYSSGTIARLDDSVKQYVQKVRQDVPFEAIKNWLQYCKTKHDDWCNQTSSMHPIETRFVDCIHNGIIAATMAVSYTALSYAWGEHRTDRPQQESNALLRDLPRTIADAMTATVKLGYRYLWVDQLCIPAGDASEFARQVSQMDKIYHDAELVLIAAAGTDSNCGLPGVGIRKRFVQACERIGNFDFISTMTHPQTAMSAATWNTRAWTYQESVCARKRLVFTDGQCLFVCNSGIKQEGVNSVSLNHYGRNFPSTKLSERTPWETARHVAAYSRRELTHQEDALNAILGVFRTLSQAKNPVHHVYGVSILPNFRLRGGSPAVIMTNCSTRLILGLCWIHITAGRRRDRHTWAGWQCPIDENIPEWTNSLQRADDVWEVCAVKPRLASATDIDDDLESFLNAFHPSSSRDELPLLRITGSTVSLWVDGPVVIASDTTQPCCRVRATERPNGITYLCPLLNSAITATSSGLGTLPLTALVVATEYHDTSSPGVWLYRDCRTLFIVLQHVEGDVYERVGHFPDSAPPPIQVTRRTVNIR